MSSVGGDNDRRAQTGGTTIPAKRSSSPTTSYGSHRWQTARFTPGIPAYLPASLCSTGNMEPNSRQYQYSEGWIQDQRQQMYQHHDHAQDQVAPIPLQQSYQHGRLWDDEHLFLQQPHRLARQRIVDQSANVSPHDTHFEWEPHRLHHEQPPPSQNNESWERPGSIFEGMARERPSDASLAPGNSLQMGGQAWRPWSSHGRDYVYHQVGSSVFELPKRGTGDSQRSLVPSPIATGAGSSAMLNSHIQVMASQYESSAHQQADRCNRQWFKDGEVALRNRLCADEVRSLQSKLLAEKDRAEFASPLRLPGDRENLTVYQVVLRDSLEYFSASQHDVDSPVRGRKQKIRLRQIGVRCRYCAHLRLDFRGKGAVYYPRSLINVYQAAQNIAGAHFSPGRYCCPFAPGDIIEQISIQKPRRDSSKVGRSYWVNACHKMGICEKDNALWLHRGGGSEDL